VSRRYRTDWTFEILTASVPIAYWAFKCFLMVASQNRMIYMRSIPPGSRRRGSVTPADHGLSFREGWIQSGRESLHYYEVWRGKEKSNASLMVYFQGNAGNSEHRFEKISRLLLPGMRVLLPSVRGYYLSSGRPSERGLQQDGEHILQRAYEMNGRQPVTVAAHSLGVAVALHAVTAASNEDRVSGLVLDSGFTSIVEMLHYLFPSWSPYTKLGWFIRSRWENGECVRKLKRTPVLFICGQADTDVPPRMTRELYDKCTTAGQKSLVELRGVGHNDTFTHPKYADVVQRFVRNHQSSPTRCGPTERPQNNLRK